MSTVKMKLVGAIVVGGEVVRPPAIVEVSEAEAVNLAHRGKAVPATENDSPTATSPSAEVAKGGQADADALAAATEALAAAEAEAANVDGKSRAQKKADADAVDAAKAAVAKLTPAT